MDHVKGTQFEDIRLLVLDILEKADVATPGTVYKVADDEETIEVHFWGNGQFSIPSEHKETRLGAFLIDAFKFICGQHKVVQHNTLERMLTQPDNGKGH